jgi:hypothetical protein
MPVSPDAYGFLAVSAGFSAAEENIGSFSI